MKLIFGVFFVYGFLLVLAARLLLLAPNLGAAAVSSAVLALLVLIVRSDLRSLRARRGPR